jgi:Spy/CpxP family protein refolding chaperone
MKKPLLAAFVLSGVVLAAHRPASAQDAGAQQAPSQNTQATIDQNIELMRKDIRSQKKQLIAANVSLTDTEAQAFWPVYDQYTADLVKINNDKYALIKEYAQSYNTMTDAQADDWTKRVLKMDADLAALRMKYQPMFRKVLPAKKCALYEQVERQAQMMIDTQLAMQVPLVQP